MDILKKVCKKIISLKSVHIYIIVTIIGFNNGCFYIAESTAPTIPSSNDSTSESRHRAAFGKYKVYYGGFHNHSNVSDGTGTPDEAYRYARDEAGLDFFGLSDHDAAQNDSVYHSTIKTANSYNADSIFTTFWGFEWSSGTYGHIAIINSDDFTSCLDSGSTTFSGICSWIEARDCIAILNHPGRQDRSSTEFNHFSSPVCDKIVGMELWNKGTSFSAYYYNDGYYTGDNQRGFFDEALARGWKIGAAGGEDNHYGNWGTLTNFRIAILAEQLTRTNLLSAMKARRFYSTLDKNLALSFTIAGNEMGSTIPSGNCALRIQTFDADSEGFSNVMLFDKDHSIRKSWDSSEPIVDISDTLLINTGDYYYVKVTEADGDEAISSPIWVN